MKASIKKLMTVFVLITAVAATAADIDMNRLGEELADVQTYKTGDGAADLRFLESTAAQCVSDPALREQVENKILLALAQTQTTEGKSFLCRLLRTVGTAKSVPALEALVTNRELSHMARYALGRITAPEARKALLRALDTTTRDLKAGAINTLARRRCREALPVFIKLINANDKTVARAAIRALGHLGGPDAVKALLSARGVAAAQLRTEIDDALLGCAELHLERGELKQAEAVYILFYEKGEPPQLKLAGLRGLAASAGDRGAGLLSEAIKNGDSDLSRNAIQMLALVKGETVTQTLMELFKPLPSDRQVLVVRALAKRRDASALPLLMRATKHADEGVRLAAYEALAGYGTIEVIQLLAGAAAAAPEREKRVAKASLVGLRGKAMARLYLRAMKSASSASRVEILNTIGQRAMKEAFKTLHELACKETDGAVRREAILDMGRVGGHKVMDTLLKLAATPKEAGDRDAIRRAIETGFKTIASPVAKTRILLKALKSADDAMKPMLFMLLAGTGTAPAFNAVKEALKAENTKVRAASAEALGHWPDAQPLRLLFRLANAEKDKNLRTQALRGCIRLADFAKAPTAMYLKALSMTDRPEDVKLILEGLGRTDTLDALETALRFRKQKTFKAEAERAAVRIAGRYSWQDNERAIAVLNKIRKEATNGGLVNEINRIFQELDRFKGHIRAWKGVGPYTLENINDGNRVFNTAFAPEKDPKAKNLMWRSIKVDRGNDRIDLEKNFGSIDYCCAYLRTKILSPTAQTVRYRRDVDDYFKAWLNGSPVEGDQLTLKEGINEFMIKVGDHGGGWNFNCRLEKLDGKPLENVSFKL